MRLSNFYRVAVIQTDCSALTSSVGGEKEQRRSQQPDQYTLPELDQRDSLL